MSRPHAAHDLEARPLCQDSACGGAALHSVICSDYLPETLPPLSEALDGAATAVEALILWRILLKLEPRFLLRLELLLQLQLQPQVGDEQGERRDLRAEVEWS